MSYSSDRKGSNTSGEKVVYVVADKSQLPTASIQSYFHNLGIYFKEHPMITILLAGAVIGGTGYYVYDKRKKYK